MRTPCILLHLVKPQSPLGLGARSFRLRPPRRFHRRRLLSNRSLRGGASVLEHCRTCGTRGLLYPLDKHVFARLCTDSDEFQLEDVTCHSRLRLPEHLVAAVTTGLVVSARGVATREGDFQVQRQFGSFPEWALRRAASQLLVLEVKHFVLFGGAFPDEGVLKSQTGVYCQRLTCGSRNFRPCRCGDASACCGGRGQLNILRQGCCFSF